MAASPARLALILGALTAFTPLAVDMYLPGLPVLARQLRAEPAAVQLTLSLFFLGLVVGQLFLGPLSDRYGRRRPLLAGTVLFALASIACALAPTAEALAGWRFVQAFGSCAGMVIGRAMVRDLFPPQEIARMFSRLMLVIGVVPILAPLLGGYVLTVADWPAIFWVQAAFALLVLLMALRFLPETHAPNPAMRLNPWAVLQQYGEVLRERRFLGFSLASCLPMTAMFAYIAASPFVFIDLFGFSPQAYGIVFGANAFGFVAAAQLNRWALAHFTMPDVLAAAGWFQLAAGAALVLAALTGIGGAFGLVVPLFLVIAPLGLILPNAGALALTHHGARAGTASALVGIMQFGGGGIVSALIGLAQDGTALPLAAVMAACVLGGVLSRWLLVRDET